MRGPHGLPLPTIKYMFIGEDNEDHLCGEFYTVIETGWHWIKEFGHVIWVTTEEDRNTTDIDYGLSCSIDYFQKNFRSY